MCWFFVILFLSLTYGSVSETRHDKELPSVVVVGTVYCDTSFRHEFSKGSYFISDASVAVECKDRNSILSFRKEVKTDEHGEFKVKLPFKVRKHAKRINGCTFKLISSSEPHCAVASAVTSSSLRLKTIKQGEHIFSAGSFPFKPIKKPNFCTKKQSVQNSKLHGYVKHDFSPNSDKSQSQKLSAEDTFLPPIPFLPPISFLPPIPFFPPIPLPPIPFLPPIPLPPIPLLPPNPFLPPNPLLPPQIPNSLQPQSPPPNIPNQV